MKNRNITIQFVIGLICLAVCSLDGAVSGTGMREVASPDKRFELRVIDGTERYSYWLVVSDRASEIARYRFQGDLISAYWAWSGRYVAINNHWGHRGWYLWVIALPSGAVLRAAGLETSREYNRYLDYHYGPDVVTAAQKQILAVYPTAAADRMREEYISIARGWEKGDRLRMFHEFIYNRLATNGVAVIWIDSIFRVSQEGIAVSSISARMAGQDSTSGYPEDVERTLDLQTTSK